MAGQGGFHDPAPVPPQRPCGFFLPIRLWRRRALGTRHSCRDTGYAIGALLLGAVADWGGGLVPAMWGTAMLVALSGLWIALAVEESRPRQHAAGQAAQKSMRWPRSGMSLCEHGTSRWLPAASLLLAALACYGTLAVVALLAAVGVAVAINGAVWAGAIAGFAGLATLGIAIGALHHRRPGPLLIALPGLAAIAWVMFGRYSRGLELVGFMILAAATAWDWQVRPRRCVPPPIPARQPRITRSDQNAAVVPPRCRW